MTHTIVNLINDSCVKEFFLANKLPKKCYMRYFVAYFSWAWPKYIRYVLGITIPRTHICRSFICPFPWDLLPFVGQPKIWLKPSQKGSIQGKANAAIILHLQPIQIPDLKAIQMMSPMLQLTIALIIVPAHRPQVFNGFLWSPNPEKKFVKMQRWIFQ